MRAFPVHIHQSFHFARLKGLTWSIQGAGPNSLVTIQRGTGDALAALLKSSSSAGPLILDCQGMQKVEDDALKLLAKALADGGSVLCVRPDGVFNDDLKRMLGSASAEYTLDGPEKMTVTVFGDHISKQGADQLRKDALNFEKTKLEQFVANSFHFHRGENNQPVMQRMESTLLWANGVFDARLLMSDPNTFSWICMAMADRLDELLAGSSARPAPKRLLSVSLRGSPFAAAASLLSQGQVPVEIVDHMGPKHRILEEHHLDRPGEHVQYIFVGDFVVGGTELKVAMTYAHTRGGSLTNAVVIGTLKSHKDYAAASGIEILSLVDLTKVRSDVKITFDGGAIQT